MWLKSFKQNRHRSSKAFALEFFFGSGDRLGTDLVFLGTGEMCGEIRDIMESEKSIFKKEIRNEDQMKISIDFR